VQTSFIRVKIELDEEIVICYASTYMKLIVLILLSTVATLTAETREWSRGKDKDPLVAEFLYLDKATKSVVLMKEDGDEIKVPFSKLGKDDKAFITKGAKSLANEAKRRKIATEVSEIFGVRGFNTTFVATSCYSVGDKSKLPSSFMIMGDVQDRGGKSGTYFKGKLTLVRFLDVAVGGGVGRRPLYRATSVRPAPQRNIRDARKGR